MPDPNALREELQLAILALSPMECTDQRYSYAIVV